MEDSIEPIQFPDLVFGLVGPIGVQIDVAQDGLANALRIVGYDPKIVHVTRLVEPYREILKVASSGNEYDDKIRLANEFCRKAGNAAALAGLSIAHINEDRSERSKIADKSAENPTAYIIRQLKRKQEIEILRDVYGTKFVQISISLDKDSRILNLIHKLSAEKPEKNHATAEKEARELVERDEHEFDGESEASFGQGLDEIFHLGDFFVGGNRKEDIENQIGHCVKAFFGDTSISPNRDEFGSYMAAAAALRSVDLSRQVGSAILTEQGDLISVGCNEVPRPMGGNYWYDDIDRQRDIDRGVEQNNLEKKRIIQDVVDHLKNAGIVDTKNSDLHPNSEIYRILEKALISDITEYGRMTHAEMASICDAARLGRPLNGSTMYVTTFPCHNCAKHIIASGIRRVVFIEPYPKSKAPTSHSDAISFERNVGGKVVFEHFHGISPRRYRDIFEKRKRTSKDEILKWYEGKPTPRVRERDNLHSQREIFISKSLLKEILRAEQEFNKNDPQGQS